jgi:predicted ester cyclase
MEHDLRALSRRWFEQVWNNRHEATIDEMLAPDCVAHGLGDDDKNLDGPDGFRRFYYPFRSAFPDMNVVVEDVLRDGDKTAVRLSFTATHAGDGLGIAPTGRAVHSTGIILLRWRDGQVVEAWNEFDAAGMMSQLAAPPAAAAAVKLKA